MTKNNPRFNLVRISKESLTQHLEIISFLRHTMDIQLINIGFGNMVSVNRIISIVSPESAPIKRLVVEARNHSKLIDATYGRKTRAVMITDAGYVILSPMQPETVAHRLHPKEQKSHLT